MAAVALGIGIVNAFSKAQDAAWHGGVYDLRTPLFWELSSIVTIIAVIADPVRRGTADSPCPGMAASR